MERGKKRKFQTVGDIVPDLVRKYRTFKPTEIAQLILADYNTNVTPESVTMFFKRHPEIETELRREIVSDEKENIVVSESIFSNGTFEELPSIKKLIIEQRPRVAPRVLEDTLGAIKCICLGKYTDIREGESGRRNYVEKRIPAWTLKHPDRLTLEHAKEYIAFLHGLGRNTHRYRLGARAFFLSRDSIKVKPTDIAGDKGEIGKYGKVVVPKETLSAIFNHMKAKNFDYYACNHSSYKTATRITATLTETKKSNMREEDGITVLDIKDKGLHRKGRQKWTKIIPPDVRDELLWLFSKYGDSAFAHIDAQDLRAFNKEVYQLFLTDNPKALELAMKEPFHFWRHMFAQHMLRATNWNYDIVAELGGWSDTNTLKKCYGSPPQEVLRKAGITIIPTI